MKVLNQMYAISVAALLGVYSPAAVGAEVASQKPVMLEISARGHITSKSDRISVSVMVVSDAKTGKQQTLEKLRTILGEIAIGPDAITPSRQSYGFIGNPTVDAPAEPENPFTQMARMAVYRIVLTDPSKYDSLYNKLSGAGFYLAGPPISSLNDDRPARAAARFEAFRRAESEAQDLAEKLNLKIQRAGKISYVCPRGVGTVENLLVAVTSGDDAYVGSDLQTVVTHASVCIEFEAMPK